VAGINFDSAVLTNMSHEHLDYHKSFNNYLKTKLILFQKAKSFVVLNRDDASYKTISESITGGVKIQSYAILSKKATLYAQNISLSEKGTEFEIIDGINAYTQQTRLFGEYNAANLQLLRSHPLQGDCRELRIIKSSKFSLILPIHRIR